MIILLYFLEKLYGLSTTSPGVVVVLILW